MAKHGARRGIALVLWALLLGCAEHDAGSTDAALAFQAGASRPSDGDVAQGVPVPDRASPLSLAHAFGVVRPGERLTKGFRIENTSGEEWTFAGIRNGCKCTAARLSAASIRPGTTETIEVTYHAGRKVG